MMTYRGWIDKEWSRLNIINKTRNSTACNIIKYKDGRRVVLVEPPYGRYDALGFYPDDYSDEVMGLWTSFGNGKHSYSSEDVEEIQRGVLIIPRKYLKEKKTLWKKLKDFLMN